MTNFAGGWEKQASFWRSLASDCG